MSKKQTQEQEQSLRDRVMSRTARRYATYDVPGFGKVTVRSWNELERAQFEAITADETVVKRWLVVLSVVDHQGAGLTFTPEDIDELGKVDSVIIDQIAAIAFRHNSITPEDQKTLLGKPANC